jgi:putative PIN family toxin of toxin-antitoxin system
VYAVIDTNVIVSAFWSPQGTSARLIALVQNGLLIPCYDARILTEYREVLLRPRFGFSDAEVNDFLELIERDGISVVPVPCDINFTDEDDKMFYEVAKHCNASLITGNPRHYPDDGLVISVRDFLTDWERIKAR